VYPLKKVFPHAFFIMVLCTLSLAANAKYTCDVQIEVGYFRVNANGDRAYQTVSLYDESFSSKGVATFDGGVPSRTQKCMKTAWETLFPKSLNVTESAMLLDRLNLDAKTKAYYCDGGEMSTPWNWGPPASWADNKKYISVIIKAKKLIGKGTRRVEAPAWIPKQWCDDFEAQQAAIADQQAEENAQNAACLTCLYTWDGKYHSCATKMGFKYSAAPIDAADSVSELQCRKRSDYLRTHTIDKSVLPYDVTIPPLKPVTAESALKGGTPHRLIRTDRPSATQEKKR